MTIPYEQPSIITMVGGIDLNGREGAVIEFGFEDGNGDPVDLTGYLLYFEVEGVLRSLMTTGTTAYFQNITISQADTVALYEAGAREGVGLPFVVRYESIVPPQVLWEGTITVHGYIA